MPSSAETLLWSELESGGPRAASARAYRRARAKNRLYNFVVSRFLEAEKHGLTKAKLAKRMGTRPEVVGRYLASPGNWTMETVSDLLLCISAEELRPAAVSVLPQTSPFVRATPETWPDDRTAGGFTVVAADPESSLGQR